MENNNGPKPIKKIEIIEKIYWECNFPEHRHQTEKAAMTCIKARPHPVKPRKGYRKIWIKVAKNIMAGATWKEAGASVGRSGERARQMTHKLFRISIHPANLSNRPDGINDFAIKTIRKNATFWAERIEYMEKKWGMNDSE